MLEVEWQLGRKVDYVGKRPVQSPSGMGNISWEQIDQST
jgi:hypothetical protein